MSKINWQQSNADRELLNERFPHVFRPFGVPKKPLAIGIHRKVAEAFPELSSKRIREALHNYTSGPTYLRNLREGAPRIDLDGSTTTVVTKEQSDQAKAELKRRGMNRVKKKEPPAHDLLRHPSPAERALSA